jgi:hypothetical protein
MKNLKERIENLIRKHGPLTIAQINRYLHVRKYDIIQTLHNFDYSYNTNSYSIKKKTVSTSTVVIDEQLQHLQLTVREMNIISKPHGILFYYRVGPSNVDREPIKLYTEPLKNEYHIERYLYAGDIPSCVKYLKFNKNRQEFFKNLKWSLSRPQCFHGDVNRGCDASGVLFNKKTMKECEECKFYRGYPMGGSPLEKELKSLESLMKDQTDFYFGTVVLKANLIKRMIDKIRNNDKDVVEWFVAELRAYFIDKSCCEK